jgi:RHS repeat-associated protein
MGDFRTSTLSPYNTGKTNTAIDYVYDVNGNMTRDLNKDIGSQSTDGITYNHLNLPWQVRVRSATGTKGTITYIYDAAGNKLKKTTVDSAGSMQTVTTYIGPFQYQGKRATGANNGAPADTLQLISQEEGRIRVAFDTTGGQAKTSFKYDYFIKDHLGNTRMVLTDEQQTDRYPAATMEPGAAVTENLFYSKLDNTRTALPAGYPSDTTTNPNQNVARLNGGTAGPKIGPGITLKVMSGDQFSIRASSWYRLNGTSPGTPANPLSDLLAALISGIGSLPGGGHPSPAVLQANSTPLSDNLTAFLSDTGASINSTRPHAFVNWVLFDEQFNYVAESSGFEQVGSDQEFKKHVRLNLPVAKSGYLYIYVSNETPNIDVFFDNLQVTHTRGPLLEETHYYPFGLTMAGISDKALKSQYVQNKNRFNDGNELQNQEFSDGSGLELYDAVHRMYDAQIGRFWQIDEFGEATNNWSPYAFGTDNPIEFNDPFGLDTLTRKTNLDPVYVTAKHTTKNLQNTYWDLMNRGVSLDRVKDKGLRNWLYSYDRQQKFLDKVHENIRTQGIIVANIASFFIPVGEIAQLARLGELAQLYRLKRGLEVAEGTGALVKVGVDLSTHALDRLAERGITKDMIEVGISKGAKFFDPKNKTINYVLKGGFASGKDLLIGTNPLTGRITTAIRGTNLVSSRFIPL